MHLWLLQITNSWIGLQTNACKQWKLLTSTNSSYVSASSRFKLDVVVLISPVSWFTIKYLKPLPLDGSSRYRIWPYGCCGSSASRATMLVTTLPAWRTTETYMNRRSDEVKICRDNNANCERLSGIMLNGVAKLSKDLSLYCQSVRARHLNLIEPWGVSSTSFVRCLGKEGKRFALQVFWLCRHCVQKSATLFNKYVFFNNRLSNDHWPVFSVHKIRDQLTHRRTFFNKNVVLSECELLFVVVDVLHTDSYVAWWFRFGAINVSSWHLAGNRELFRAELL